MDGKDWRMLKVLYAEKSISKAASALYLSHPALTYRLEQLEKEFNVALFIRSSKGIRFTSAGERLLSFADKLLRQYEDIKKYVTAYEGDISGILRLGSSAVFAHNQRRIAPFGQRYFQVNACRRYLQRYGFALYIQPV